MPVDLAPIVRRQVEAFAAKRRATIEKLTINNLLSRKNPYLFIARGVDTPAELAEELVSAALSSSEETQFGNTLESIAIEICEAVYGGQKSAASGVDLEFNRAQRRYIVAIKSGPNWGNSSQIRRMRQDLNSASRLIRQHNLDTNVMAVNGCCYGRGDTDFGDYRKVCGTPFWELISGDPDLYLRLIAPLKDASSNGFVSERRDLVERLGQELTTTWSQTNGTLDEPSRFCGMGGG